MKCVTTGRSTICLAPLVLLTACAQGTDETAKNDGATANASAVPIVSTTSFEYRNLCEASAAAVLDDTHFVVASDDSEDLAIYTRGQAQPLTTFHRNGVTDIEGATRIGETIVWLTSHSLNKDGVDKEKRRVLFGTDIITGPTLQETDFETTDLRGRIASVLEIEEEELKPWLNAEGLASDANGNLLVGLRGAPKSEKRTYVVRLKNPFVTAESGSPQAETNAGSPDRSWLLDLGERGIRSMERAGEGAHSYLILAGPRGDEAKTFALFWWDGASEAVTPGPAVDFGDMTPEALIVWANGEIQILGDNGDSDGTNESRCSDKDDEVASRHFPSISFSL